jgi:hypothetical protein
MMRHVLGTATSASVTARQYLQVTDDHFDRATKPGREAAQNTTQYSHEAGRNEPHKKQQTPRISRKIRGLTVLYRRPDTP